MNRSDVKTKRAAMARIARVLFLGVATTLLLALAGCTDHGGPPPRAREARPSPPPGPVTPAPPPAVVQKAQPVNCAVAMVLPLSGPYGAIGGKILNGARAARSALAGAGVGVELHEIDCTAQDWLQKLSALPPNVSLVGGPLTPDAMEALAKTDQFRKRAFFSFMQNLGKVAEGQTAWRFFSSPTDQMRALLQAAKDDFSIHRVGVLYPDEQFGARVAQLFEEEARRLGVTVSAKSSYPPDDPLRWDSIVASFLGGKPGAAPDFDAVFLPDAWAKIEMLLPFFYLQQNEQLLVMGSTLWGQTYTKEAHIPAHMFRLAVFPGVWHPSRDASGMTELRRFGKPSQEDPSVWDIIGFDFLRFAAHVGPLQQGWTPSQVNERIRLAQSMPWNMAPIVWDATGHAQQNMLLYTPGDKNIELADLFRLKQRRDILLQRAPKP